MIYESENLDNVFSKRVSSQSEGERIQLILRFPNPSVDYQ